MVLLITELILLGIVGVLKGFSNILLRISSKRIKELNQVLFVKKQLTDGYQVVSLIFGLCALIITPYILFITGIPLIIFDLLTLTVLFIALFFYTYLREKYQIHFKELIGLLFAILGIIIIGFV
ncbi:MAG: hypothetical protein OEZ01_17325 [Candidatus Heimdallarchaeota archaeon]|nr:hypothetical protein [Candidatus Heimdallarchaeota archaeon]MDH5647776.1 hypothetical protein [Candidatus Heimdallarchaeota archaeon]